MAKQKKKKTVSEAIVTILATFNNIIVTFADTAGNTLCWSSAGKCGFKGSRKGTPFAAQMAAEDAAKQALEFQVKTVEVHVIGPGAGRDSAVRALHRYGISRDDEGGRRGSSGITVAKISDLTPLPHNGCRPKKKRRV